MDVILRGRKFKKLIEGTFATVRKKYDLRQIEIEILLFLKKYPNTSSSEIYRALDVNKGHVSQAMDNLCKKNFLESRQDESDRRYVSYQVTDSGKRVVEESLKLRDNMLKQVFAEFSKEEMEMMCKISKKLIDNIDRIQLD